MILYVIRHGDPDYSIDNLTPLGKRQAEAVGRRLAATGIDRIFSSPLGRAKATAAPLCEMLHMELKVEDWLSEQLAWDDISAPDSEGRVNFIYNSNPSSLFKTDGLLNASVDEFDASDASFGVSVAKALKRIGPESDRLLSGLGYTRVSKALYEASPGSEERVAVFCHEGAGMLWMPYLLGMPPHIFWSSFAFTHTSVSIFHFEPKGITSARCLALCDTSHLYAERLPLRHNNLIKY